MKFLPSAYPSESVFIHRFFSFLLSRFRNEESSKTFPSNEMKIKKKTHETTQTYGAGDKEKENQAVSEMKKIS